MSAMLTQAEADALLHAVNNSAFDNADTPLSETRELGWLSDYMTCEHIQKLHKAGIANKRDEQYSKEQERVFSDLFEDVVANASEICSRHLNKRIELDLVSVDELTVSELLASLSSPGCIKLFKLRNATDCGLYEVTPSLLIAMTAPENAQDVEWSRTTLTQEELQIAEYLGNALFAEIAKAFNTVSRLKFKYAGKQFIMSPQRVRDNLIPSNVLTVSVEARMERASGLISLAFPQSQVNFLLLTQDVKKAPGCIKEDFSWACQRCKLLQEYLKREFKDLVEKERA